MPGGLTPICDSCGISLCWDIGEEEYHEAKAFWDAWVCRDCNGGTAMSLGAWRSSVANRERGHSA
jgi:hypothetical protein